VARGDDARTAGGGALFVTCQRRYQRTILSKIRGVTSWADEGVSLRSPAPAYGVTTSHCRVAVASC